MDPVTFILWIGVAVFAATSVIAVLFLAGIVKGPYGKLLVGTLITQIVIACIAAFSSQISKRNVLPVSNLLIVEKGQTQVVYDGTTAVYLSAPDVAIDRRVVTLKIDLHDDFSTAKQYEIKLNVAQIIEIQNRKYRVWYAKMGKIFDPTDPFERDDDFVFLSVAQSK